MGETEWVGGEDGLVVCDCSIIGKIEAVFEQQEVNNLAPRLQRIGEKIASWTWRA